MWNLAGPMEGVGEAWAGIHTINDGSWFVKVVINWFETKDGKRMHQGEKYRTSFPHRFQAKAWAEQMMRQLLKDKKATDNPPIRRFKPLVDYMPPLYRTNQEIAEHEAFLKSLEEKERSEPCDALRQHATIHQHVYDLPHVGAA